MVEVFEWCEGCYGDYICKKYVEEFKKLSVLSYFGWFEVFLEVVVDLSKIFDEYVICVSYDVELGEL